MERGKFIKFYRILIEDLLEGLGDSYEVNSDLGITVYSYHRILWIFRQRKSNKYSFLDVAKSLCTALLGYDERLQPETFQHELFDIFNGTGMDDKRAFIMRLLRLYLGEPNTQPIEFDVMSRVKPVKAITHKQPIIVQLDDGPYLMHVRDNQIMNREPQPPKKERGKTDCQIKYENLFEDQPYYQMPMFERKSDSKEYIAVEQTDVDTGSKQIVVKGF